ncbi:MULTISPECIES: NAD-dependent epimerase/dehydratase family protein [Francisella]|uniref:NAD-dependent epimerase n=1 Tax=Francisella opportunistica TaxID=2016517 RepID=A0A345JQ07_9GAMM|nr:MULTISPECIES: NAD-dependent epimerase/dehydratase family protein [Francisella]APC91092.1 UDP-glucose 4-epimerase [Francisella sp. MA067296]AXH29403.1 NAD-dependent epimerase [Francisella opportunistica]AXH31055.1 NAD-dependent epimerase [Francisella opportunistica]AXH32700.1 NAD-dependent epimerase [Francisella opportunistica]
MKKKILITGINSYVGNSFSEFCKDNFDIDKISLRDVSLVNIDLNGYDAILHVAGIAHTSKEPKLKEKYYKINTQLTYDLAKKAKDQGVRQFVFLSSIIVYGDSAPIGQQKVITKDTEPKPDDFYGDSKLQAEIKLNTLISDGFNIAIIRPPMVYGNGSKGNYPKLLKLAKYAFIFPNINNQRSVISIDNLSKEIAEIILQTKYGIFLPQDSEYFNTSKFIKDYRKNVLAKNTYLTVIFNPIIRVLAKKVDFVNKVFGNLTYEK